MERSWGVRILRVKTVYRLFQMDCFVLCFSGLISSFVKAVFCDSGRSCVTKGDWIHCFTRETTFMTSFLLSGTTIPFWKGVYSKSSYQVSVHIKSFRENTPVQKGTKAILKELSPLKGYHFTVIEWEQRRIILGKRMALYQRCLLITKTCLFKYIENFTTKNWKFSDKNSDIFSYFSSKHRLWVLVRTASPRRF